MNKQLIAFLIICAIASISTVYAGNNTTTIDTPTAHIEQGKTITAIESGDSNISFSDGYKGYCAEWGEHSAERGDKFYIHDEVDNNIKVFFTYFYEDAQKNTIATQHMIWKFTDGKEFSRFNKTLYNQIITKSATIQVPNQGTIKIDNNTEMVFNFKMFISEFEEYQNYFGYKIFFRNISSNSSTQINNSMINNSNNYLDKYQNNEWILTEYDTIMIKDSINSKTSTSDYKKIVKFPNQHVTGNNLKLLIGSLIILSSCIKIRKLKYLFNLFI